MEAAKTYNSADELDKFEELFPAGTKSAIAKCLTKEIWEEYKDKKDAAGVPFKVMCFSGVKNLDSGIGVYAGSHDSYTTFNGLFDKIIKDYHGHGPEDKHVSDMKSEGLTNTDFSEEDASMILSTRIRVGRNLADYPLGPGVTKEQRLEIMDKVVKACDTFQGDLAGKFYKLEGMDPKDQ